MSWKKGAWGVVVAVGGALAITAWYDDNPVLAGVLGAGTAIVALVVYLRTSSRAPR